MIYKPSRIAAAWAMAAVVGALGPVRSALPAESVHTAQSREITGKLVALDAAGAVVQREDGRHVVPSADIVRITLAGATGGSPMARKGQHVVCAKDGSFLAARNVTVRDGKCQALTDMAGQVSLPLERVARILRPSSNETPSRLERELRQLGALGGKEDALVVRTPAGEWVVIKGILASLAQGQVSFTYEGAEASMKDDTIAAIVLVGADQTGAPPQTGGQLTGADGSRIAFKSLRLDAGQFVVDSAWLGALRLGRGGVSEIRFRREDRAFLSDLTPASASETPFFDDVFAWQKDRSVSGHALSLNGVTYEKGLGLHARCRLVFDLRGEYRRFSAIAGIDDELRCGRAVLSIIADGKPLVDRLLLDRTQPARKLDLDLRGLRALTILVDFAEGTFGSGARVNLCDPALTK